MHFLLGYHYLMLSHAESSLREFRQASELKPRDTVVAALVASLAPRDKQPAQAPSTTAPQPVPANDVTGTWTAAGTGTAKYSMSLLKDGTFTWSFTRGSRKQEVKGVWTLEGNVLAMEPNNGGVCWRN